MKTIFAIGFGLYRICRANCGALSAPAALALIYRIRHCETPIIKLFSTPILPTAVWRSNKKISNPNLHRSGHATPDLELH
jgi:hypothetical protein